MNIANGELVLDLGIGTGQSLQFYPGCGKVIGVDLSNGMLREARRKIEEKSLSHATVFQADAMNLPFADDTFDHIFISHVISVVSDPIRLVREAARRQARRPDHYPEPFPEHEPVFRPGRKMALPALHQARLAQRSGPAGPY